MKSTIHQIFLREHPVFLEPGFRILLLYAMAKQRGDIMIVGTIDNVTFYELNGQYCLRIKSSLTRKRVKRDKAFEKARQSSNELAQASPLASLVYRAIPNREKWQFQSLVGLAKKMFQAGKDGDEVLRALQSISPHQLPRPSKRVRNSSPGKSYIRASDLKKAMKRNPDLEERDIRKLVKQPRPACPTGSFRRGFTGPASPAGGLTDSPDCIIADDCLLQQTQIDVGDEIAGERLYHAVGMELPCCYDAAAILKPCLRDAPELGKRYFFDERTRLVKRRRRKFTRLEASLPELGYQLQ